MKKIFVAGHNGMVGSAILKKLKKKNYEIITADRSHLDLTNQRQVKNFFKENKFDEVFLAAAKVGGILANNSHPADFIYQNLMIQNNIIFHAYKNNIKKLLFLGSSCIYPKLSKQPMKEEDLLSGYLEPTNEPYAIAKISGIKLCESFNRQFNCDFRSVMPTNLYGPNDNFNLEDSHVLPALIRKFHEAKIKNINHVEVWGTGNPFREFLHVDDLADAVLFINNIKKNDYYKHIDPMTSHINIGSGVDYSIRELAELIASIVGFKGDIIWNKSMPDGAPKKLLDTSKINKFGWVPKVSIEEGIKTTYQWFLTNQTHIRS
jgi:GDP-L-fucose synthase